MIMTAGQLTRGLLGPVIIAVVRPGTHAGPDQTNDQYDEPTVE
jgi:hypothetical protein